MCVLADNSNFKLIKLMSKLHPDALKILDEMKRYTPPLLIEKPFLALRGNIHNTLYIRDLLTILQWQYPNTATVDAITARGGVCFTKEQQISEAKAITQTQHHTPLEYLCIWDCLTLKAYNE